jgi:hypothetical protein
VIIVYAIVVSFTVSKLPLWHCRLCYLVHKCCNTISLQYPGSGLGLFRLTSEWRHTKPHMFRGYAFVTMDDPQNALLCVKNISGYLPQQHWIIAINAAFNMLEPWLFGIGNLSDFFHICSGQDVDGRLIKVEVATGVRGGGAGRKGGDRGDRNGGRDRDRDRDFDKESRWDCIV